LGEYTNGVWGLFDTIDGIYCLCVYIIGLGNQSAKVALEAGREKY